MSTPLIKARQLTKHFRTPIKSPGFVGAVKHLFWPHYEEKVAVDAINLDIEAGESVAYVGPNGAGKSTTLKMLTGILVPTSGEVLVHGRIPHRQRIANNRHIGVVFGQRSQLWWDLPVQESLRLLGDIYEISEDVFERNLNEFIDLLELKPLLPKPARQLSLGQRMRCDLAASLLHSPAILYLDEPTIGLDVAVKARVREFIKHINRVQGTTVLLASHDLDDIQGICERLVMIDQGRIVYDGSLEAIKKQFGRERAVHLVLREALPEATGLVRHALRGLELTYIEQLAEHHLLIQFDIARVTAGAIIGCVLPVLPINDLHIEEPGVESIIRRFYEGELQFERNDNGHIT